MADRVQIQLGCLYGDAWPPGWTWVKVSSMRRRVRPSEQIVTGITIWARKWIKKARARDTETEPIKVVIYGPQGEVLREVEVPPPEP